jgi:flagellar biosynthetic protein FliQ
VTQAYLQGLASQTILVVLKLSLPTLVVSLVVGLAVSVFQAVTQIQEMTLSFIPKVFAIGLVIVILGPWMLNTLIAFTIEMFRQIPVMTAS